MLKETLRLLSRFPKKFFTTENNLDCVSWAPTLDVLGKKQHTQRTRRRFLSLLETTQG